MGGGGGGGGGLHSSKQEWINQRTTQDTTLHHSEISIVNQRPQGIEHRRREVLLDLCVESFIGKSGCEEICDPATERGGWLHNEGEDCGEDGGVVRGILGYKRLCLLSHQNINVRHFFLSGRRHEPALPTVKTQYTRNSDCD